MRRMISALSKLIPTRMRRRLVGSPGDPSAVANAIHSVLNRVPGEPFPCLRCSGVLEGFKMRVDWSRFRAFAYGTWEPEVVEAVKEVVHDGFVAINVGAHHGYYALLLSRLVGSAGRVIAFEPMPSNFQILSDNISLNHCTNVEIVNKAVSDRSGRLKAGPRNESDSGTFSLFKQDGPQSIAIDVTSLDDFLGHLEGPVNFIEIDVEGAEGLVIKGALRTIKSQHPILLIEVHDIPESSESRQVPGQLLELGYEIRWLTKSEGISHLLATWNRGLSERGIDTLALCGS
jgi:FkbM family methyltransferase